MSPVTHFLSGWVLANAVDLNRRDRAIVTIAAVVPDVDGLGIVAEILTRHSQHPLLWFSDYHHALHTLLFALVVFVCAFIVSTRKWISATLAFVAFHLHLLKKILWGREGRTVLFGQFPTCFHSATDGFGVGEAGGNSMLGPMLR